MTTDRAARVGSRRPQRQHRSRPTPKWLTQSRLEATARSRCLLVLSVLSGERPVTQAIADAKISRGLYYQLETRALWAMLSALSPRTINPSSRTTELSAARARIAQLQAQVQRLEQEKRRTQRLLLLTRKSIHAPVKTTHRGPWPKSPKTSRGASRSSLSTSSAQPSVTPSSTPPGAPSL